MMRFATYETMDIFKDATKSSLELTVEERIWGVMQKQVVAVVEFFGLTDEDIYLAVINRKEDIKHICGFYILKLTSWTYKTWI